MWSLKPSLLLLRQKVLSGATMHTGHFLWSAHHSMGVTGGGVVRGYTRAGQVVDVTVPGPRGFAPRT